MQEIDAAPTEAVPMLIDIIQDDNSGRRSRYYAFYLLRKIGPPAREALPVLRKLRDNADGRSRESIQRAIDEISREDDGDS